MALKFRCSGCGRMLVAPFMKAGDVVKCGGCGAEMEVPRYAVETDQEAVYRERVRTLPVKEATLASRGSRFGAWMIDVLAYLIPVYLINPVQNDEALHLLAWLGILVVYTAVQWTLLTVEGQTLGKMIMQVKIVEVATGKNGGFVTNVLLRNVVNFLISIVPFYLLVDVLFIFREDRRCIHDLIAGTRVVRAQG
jgi:uncharacterized RDD family membrane protein YckC